MIEKLNFSANYSEFIILVEEYYSYYKTETFETRDIQLELLKVRLCQ